MMNQADENSYFLRLAISPDPTHEDRDHTLFLRELTERIMQRLEDRFQCSLPWVAAIHADHAEHRHVHAIVIVPNRLTVQDLQRLRTTATEAALEQLERLDLLQAARMRDQGQDQEQREGLELGL